MGEVGLLHQLLETDDLVAHPHVAVAELHILFGDLVMPRGELGQALLEDFSGVLRGLAVESAPLEAAVGDVLGTLSVLVAVIWMRSKSTRNTCATTCATLVFRPWPISVPPWFRWMLPSV